jgi:hypothetical protein
MLAGGDGMGTRSVRARRESFRSQGNNHTPPRRPISLADEGTPGALKFRDDIWPVGLPACGRERRGVDPAGAAPNDSTGEAFKG